MSATAANAATDPIVAATPAATAPEVAACTASAPAAPARRVCKLCEKPLVAIGRARANGKRSHADWDSRELHKQCWRRLQNPAPKRRWGPYTRY